jgi:hypothetical protein
MGNLSIDIKTIAVNFEKISNLMERQKDRDRERARGNYLGCYKRYSKFG